MKNRYLAALKEDFNLVGLASVAAVSMAMASSAAIPILLAGLVIEAAYLIFVPDTKWFEKRLARRHDAEIQKHREEMKNQVLPRLRPSLQNRFAKLEEERRDIDKHASDDQMWMREVLRKLDFLLEKFLQFALKDEQFRSYLFDARMELEPSFAHNRSRPVELSDRFTQETIIRLEEIYYESISRIEQQHSHEEDPNTQAILLKRLEVLKRRRDFIGRIGKIITNLSQQLALLEDTFGLISDELLARPPEQVLGDIEDVVSQTNTMTQVLEELAPYERMLSKIGS